MNSGTPLSTKNSQRGNGKLSETHPSSFRLRMAQVVRRELVARVLHVVRQYLPWRGRASYTVRHYAAEQ